MSKIYKVQFVEPPLDNETDFYFGSIAAIYETFTPTEIGCGVRRLWAVKISPVTPYMNKKCTVSIHQLLRKSTNRGRK